MTAKNDPRYVQLANGFRMPSVGLGTFTGYSDDTMDVAVTTAIESNGYRHIDTAYAYKNEAVIGSALKRLMDDGKVKREDLFIVTKLPMAALRADDVEAHLKWSLDSLQLEYLDLYLVHWPCGCLRGDVAGNAVIDPNTDHVTLWKKMEEMVDAGLTRSIGLCNFNVRQIQRLLDNARIKPTNLQVECHAYFQQVELYDFCRKNGIVFTAYAPLGSPGFGTIVEKISGHVIEIPPLLDDPVLKRIADRHGKSVPQILLRWLIERGMVVIPKSVTLARIQENIDIFDFQLSKAETEMIRGLNRDQRIFDLDFMKGIKEHPEYPF